MNWLLRLNSIKVQSRRDIKSSVFSMGIYVVLTAVLLFTSFQSLRGNLFVISEAKVSVLQNPLLNPFFNTMMLLAVYLGLCSAMSISKERDLGTLEVLFYGPVDSITYVIAKYLQQMLVFVIAILLSALNFYLVSMVTNLGFTSDLWGLMLLAIFVGSGMISFGILLSSLNKKITISVIVFLVFALIFLAFWYANNWMSSLSVYEYDPQTQQAVLKEFPAYYIYIRVILDKLNIFLKWISPIQYFERGSTALLIKSMTQYWLNILSSVVYSAVLLILSIGAFNRKGVKR
jgi:ABC-type transport system involved in multi-copper enzyme maturation permease subunit